MKHLRHQSSLRTEYQTMFLVTYLVFFTHFFYYYNWDLTVGGRLSYVFYFLPLFALACNYEVLNKKYIFGIEYMLFLILPLFSLLSKYILYGDSINSFYKDFFPQLLFLIYFVLVLKKFSENVIIKVILSFAFATFIIQVIQSMFPSSAIFGQNLDIKSIDMLEIRNGIYRFRLDTMFYATIFGIMYFWDKLQKEITLSRFLSFVCLMISLYLYLARQMIGIILLTLLVSLWLKSSYNKLNKYIISLILIIPFAVYFEDLFGAFVSKTSGDLSSDNSRNYAYVFLFEKCIQNPYVLLFGNGTPSIEETWRVTLHVFTNDVGFVGEWFNYGFIRIVVYLAVIYKILWKYSKKIPAYLKLFILSVFLDSILIHPFQRESHLIVWTLVVYLSEVNIKRNMRVSIISRSFLKKNSESSKGSIM